MKVEFKVGSKVVYDGIVGEVVHISTYADGRVGYGLKSLEDPELTCTAPEHECEPYDGNEIDQSAALSDAYFHSGVILGRVAKLKYGE